MIAHTDQTVSPMPVAEMMPPALIDRLQQRALTVGIVFGILSVIGFFRQPEQFFRSYLVGYMMWLGVAMGGLALLIMQYLTKGNWGFVIRRQLEAASRTLPLNALYFIPLAIAMLTHHLYPWAIGLSAEDKLIPKFHTYMTPHGALARAVVYFLLWFILAFQLNRWGKWQDERDEPDMPRSNRYQKLAGPGMILYALSITLAVVDWVMSLDNHWYSTMYGFIFIVGQGLIAMSFFIMLTRALNDYRPVSEIMQKQYWHDLGNLMLAMVMLFAYMSFSQFLIIWSGNLPEEIEWYLKRFQGGWGVIIVLIALFHFAVPFFLLLMKSIKRNPNTLVKIAGLMFVMRYVDLYWYTMPNFKDLAVFSPSWMDLVVPIALGGFWVAAFCRQLKQRPLYPVYDLLWPEITVQHHVH
jgi:hypothetical protein